MTTINSMNCSPIKPQVHQSFGRNEVITAAADWLDEIEGGQLTEDNFNGLKDVSEKMHKGPLKTFTTILGIVGAAFIGAKKGSAKIAQKVTNNPTIQKNVTKPLSKFVQQGIETATKKLTESRYFGENMKGVKSYLVNNTVKGIKAIKKYGERGSEKLINNIDKQLTSLRADLKKAQTDAKKESIKEAINILKDRKKYAATENLITKVTTTGAATGAGTVAVVEANKDRDGNGIADIAE